VEEVDGAGGRAEVLDERAELRFGSFPPRGSGAKVAERELTPDNL